MRKFYISTLLLFSFPCFCQKNFSPGYYLNQNNIKNDGFIEDTNPSINPEKILFKTSSGADATEIPITNINEFKINTDYKYIKYTVDYDYDQVIHMNEAERYGKAPRLEKKIILLKVLVEGKESLYKAVTDDIVFFYIKNSTDETPKLLIHRRYNDDYSIVENNDFRKVLYDDLKSDKLEIKDFLKIGYNENELVTLFKNFNYGNSSLVEQNVAAERNKNKFYYKIIAGTSSFISTYEFHQQFKLKTSSNFLNPLIGVEIANIFGNDSKRSEIFARIFYQNAKIEAINFSSSSTYNRKILFNADFSSINLTAGYRYAIIKIGESKLSIDGLIGVSNLINKKSFKITDTTTFTTSNPPNSNIFTYAFDELSPSIFFNFGVSYVYNNNFGINLEYSTTKNYLSKYVDLNGGLSSLNLIFTYILNK